VVISRFAGVKVQETPYGNAESVDEPVLTGGPAHDMLTKPVKLLPAEMVATTFAESPGAATVAEVGLMDNPKLSAAIVALACTFADWDAVWLESPP
jgi:hypothetical protein